MKITKSTLIRTMTAAVILVLLSCFAFADGDGDGKEGKGEGEEGGKRYTKSQVCKETRKGVLMSLEYDATSKAFVGTVKNVTKKTVERVRVEVHLSNGVELGPTKPGDLKPGKERAVTLSAKGQTFSWWSTHAESGTSEHGLGEGGEHGGEDGEHGGERKGERENR